MTCLSVLSVTLVYCGQTGEWIKMKLRMEVGLGCGHVMLDGDPATPAPKGHSPQFSAHVCCGQTAGWIKMLLCTEINLGPGDFVLDGDPAPFPLKKQGHSPQFPAHVYWGKTVAELLSIQAKRLAWGMSPKCPVLCRVGTKTLIQSINHLLTTTQLVLKSCQQSLGDRF